jgi:hypothetical protein
MKMAIRFCLCVRVLLILLTTPILILGGEPAASGPIRTGIVQCNSEAAGEDANDRSGFLPESHEPSRLMAWAGLGLMASAVGAVWRIRQSSHKRRRRRTHEGHRPASRECPQKRSSEKHLEGPLAHQRIRRYDYDRFYLRMTRDL